MEPFPSFPVQPDRRRFFVKRFIWIILALMLALPACGQALPDPPAANGGQEETAEASAPDGPGHAHDPAAEPQVIDENSPGGYCGNTVTTVRPYGAEADSEEQYSFWGGDSVALTDLLLTLDYSEGVCRCLPEFTVDTEFGTDYSINLTEFYVRHDGAQAALTEEQAESVRGIFERNITDELLPQDGLPS